MAYTVNKSGLVIFGWRLYGNITGNFAQIQLAYCSVTLFQHMNVYKQLEVTLESH